MTQLRWSKKANSVAYLDKHMTTKVLKDYQYPNEGYWQNEVYYRRKCAITQAKSENDFKFSTIIEQCPALNEDTNTIGTFTYFEGIHAIIPTTVNNYHVQLEVANLMQKAQNLTVIVNGLETATFKLDVKKEQTVKFDVALTKPSMDLTFMNTDAPEDGGDIKVSKIQLNKNVLSAAKKPRIFVASDSTAQTYTQKEYPQTGWGSMLYQFLFPEGRAIITEDPVSTYATSRVYRNDDSIIINKSIGGRSSRAFIEEGKLASLAGELRPKDYLLIQWGDNDATSYRPMRYVPADRIADYLNQYIDCAIGRGARPILVTPPAQCKFDGLKGHVSFPPYRKAMLELAAERKIPCIDLGLLSANLLTRMGPDAGHALYMQFAAGQYSNFPEGIQDQTHFNKFGAYKLAQIVSSEFSRIQSDYKLVSQEDKCLGGLSAEVENKTTVRLRFENVPEATYYRIIKQNGNKTIGFTALNNYFLDKNPGKNPKYRVKAYKSDKLLAQSLIDVPLVQIGRTTDNITGLNIYEIENDDKTDNINFSLRFTANDNIKLYRVYTFNQRTREKSLLGKIELNNVYKLHSYQVPSKGTWIVQIVGQDVTKDKQVSSKSQIISAS